MDTMFWFQSWDPMALRGEPRRSGQQLKMDVLQGDASDKVRRARLRKAPVVIGELCPGSRVYFWSPSLNRGRLRQVPARWKGPAAVIAKQVASCDFIAYRAKVLLVARGTMQHATSV